ncbi:MAG: hypothetical protein QXU67_05070 [Candidatus Bathyarchaeia archaeon]
MPEKIYSFLREHPHTPFSVKGLTEKLVYLIAEEKGNMSYNRGSLFKELYPTVKRELSRLAQRDLGVVRVKRGKFAFIPPSGYEFLDPARVLELTDKFLKLIRNILKHNISDTPEMRRILYEKLHDIISSLIYQEKRYSTL